MKLLKSVTFKSILIAMVIFINFSGTSFASENTSGSSNISNTSNSSNTYNEIDEDLERSYKEIDSALINLSRDYSLSELQLEGIEIIYGIKDSKADYNLEYRLELYGFAQSFGIKVSDNSESLNGEKISGILSDDLQDINDIYLMDLKQDLIKQGLDLNKLGKNSNKSTSLNLRNDSVVISIANYGNKSMELTIKPNEKIISTSISDFFNFLNHKNDKDNLKQFTLFKTMKNSSATERITAQVIHIPDTEITVRNSLTLKFPQNTLDKKGKEALRLKEEFFSVLLSKLPQHITKEVKEVRLKELRELLRKNEETDDKNTDNKKITKVEKKKPSEMTSIYLTKESMNPGTVSGIMFLYEYKIDLKKSEKTN